MNYPVWQVNGIGSAWVIGAISIFHVLIAWFAVGGGLYLPLAESKALRKGRRDWLPIIEDHSRFFLRITSVFGAITGVGIWFAIGLVHPEGTSTLIHNFVFGWAIEWVFFVVELAAAAVYYYTWHRISDELHIKVGYLYAASSFLTLVIINGILTFMLTPGQAWLSVAGTGQEASKFWFAFFNPTYFSGLVMRFLACLSLAGIWALVTASRNQVPELQEAKEQIVKWSSRWLLPMFVLMPLVMIWFLYEVPAENKALIQLGMNTISTGMFTQVTRIAMLTIITTLTIAGVVYFFAYNGAKEFSFGHAVAVLALAAVATASTEYARETLRKPYVIGDFMYSNGVRKSQVEGFNQNGYLTSSMWKPTGGDHLATGKAMFAGQCMSCHTENGYRSIRRLLGERDNKAISSLLKVLHDHKPDSPYIKFMPPLVGHSGEIDDLGLYLGSISKNPATVATAKRIALQLSASR